MKSCLHIVTGFKKGATYLKDSFCNSPFKIANVTEDKKGRVLQLMLMTSSPGILDNDCYELAILVEENSSLILKTQSFQRLFTMTSGADQTLNVTIGDNGSFSMINHPTVPHKGSIFSVKNTFKLGENSTLKWVEILSCGRKMNDEIFEFHSYQSITEIYQHDKLILRENLAMSPMFRPYNTIGCLEGFTHQASFIYIDGKADINTLSDRIIKLINERSDIIFGITRTSINGFIVKLLGNGSELLFGIMNSIDQLFADVKFTENVP